jgi:hypothetical protein
MSRRINFDELPQDTIASMSDADIERYIDLECAEQGVPLPTPAPQRPSKIDTFCADLDIYVVSGMQFFKREDAVKVSEFVSGLDRVKLDYVKTGDYGNDYTRRAAYPDLDDIQVETQRVFSPGYASTHNHRIAIANEQKEAYDEAMKTHQSTLSKRASIAAEFHRQRRIAIVAAERRAFLLSELSRYELLASDGPIGDHERGIALRFLAKAHPEATDVLAEIYAVNPLIAAGSVVDGLADLAERTI